MPTTDPDLVLKTRTRPSTPAFIVSVVPGVLVLVPASALMVLKACLPLGFGPELGGVAAKVPGGALAGIAGAYVWGVYACIGGAEETRALISAIASFGFRNIEQNRRGRASKLVSQSAIFSRDRSDHGPELLEKLRRRSWER